MKVYVYDKTAELDYGMCEVIQGRTIRGYQTPDIITVKLNDIVQTLEYDNQWLIKEEHETYCCEECGSTNVSEQVSINCNNNSIIDPHDKYSGDCEDCEDNVKLCTYSQYIKNKENETN